MEPPKKLLRMEEFDIKEMLINMQSTFLGKLKNIEDKIERLGTKYHLLEGKVENILNKVKEISVGVPYLGVAVNGEPSMPNLLSSNTEESYPNGSWLGDPDNPNFRVRCNISPM
nr:uncharacterized protein LOC107456867 [Parasteatoda tepidariorum]XP_042900189.1 uncharacterized protein LOC107456867 [Parasteatoda tepidariorum]XP_042900190.1 uncharacterized protein LOC107456867 [Parasteatoda tepidariorum]XP_042900191.1 uncharacterized protein LOC107456867 [Parasteatoda tepidariorum]XP_042900192.1 uncharacterized protein LOC107456867 [Parasteatoda tepidariorum]XP_042900193.1 uncharacterized protein LOC107456867 [Parasteatoda tepidariorum]